MIKKLGSQSRERIEETEYRLVGMVKKHGDTVAILEYQENEVLSAKKEEWIQNDHVSGYCIEIRGIGYEFARSI